MDFPDKQPIPPGTVECVGGPLDGQGLNPLRGDMVRLMQGAWTGSYVLKGSEYRWEPD